MQSDRLRSHDVEVVKLLDGQRLPRFEVMRKLDLTAGEASARLSKLVRYGLVYRTGRGYYTTAHGVSGLLPGLKAHMTLEEVQDLLSSPEPVPVPHPVPHPVDRQEPVPMTPFTAKRDWEEARSRAAHPAGSARAGTGTGSTGDALRDLLVRLDLAPGPEPGPEPELAPEDMADAALRHAADQAGAMQLALAHSNGEVAPAELFAMRRDLARLWVDIASAALTLETRPGL
jgi:hypothetical protein